MERLSKNRDFIKTIEEKLDIKIETVKTPPQGMDSEVFFVSDNKGIEYVVKASNGAIADAQAYRLISDNKVKIPVPKLLGEFNFQGSNVVVLEKITYPLLESVSVSEMCKYIPSMIKNLKLIHQIKSSRSGYLIDENEKRNWKEFLLSKFDNTDEYLKWEIISQREGLDRDLVLKSVKVLLEELSNTEMVNDNYSFLHTDFNQRNLFVNPKNNEIAGIIDWGESMFGDPIYDFSRIRMYIWHFNLDEEVIQNYYKEMKYTEEEKRLDTLYWLSRVIEYLAYYSEELTEFNVGRIKLHEDFLREYLQDRNAYVV